MVAFSSRRCSLQVNNTRYDENKERLVEENQQERVRSEVQILQALTQLPIAPVMLPVPIRFFQSPSSLFTLYYCHTICDLETLLESTVLNLSMVRFIGACIAQALDVLQRECQVLYRNFSPDCIQLLDSGYVALMDLRMAKKNDCNCTTLCGSPTYFAPEMLRGEVQSIATDWWGFGVLLFEIAEGEPPWGQVVDELDLLAAITAHKSGNLPEPQLSAADRLTPRERSSTTKRQSTVLTNLPAPGVPIELTRAPTPKAPGNLGNLLNKLLEPQSGNRLGADGGNSVLQHPFFGDQINWVKLADKEVESPLRGFAQSYEVQDEQKFDSEEWVHELTVRPYDSEENRWFSDYQ